MKERKRLEASLAQQKREAELMVSPPGPAGEGRNLVGLGSIGTTSSDRQSRKIDVQHERT